MERTNPLFISDVRQDIPSLWDFGAHLGGGIRRWIPRLALLPLAGGLLYYLLYSPSDLPWICGLYFLTFAFFSFRNRDGGAAYQKLLQENGGVPRRNLVYIYEDLLRYRNPETDNIVDFPYSRIRRICRTKMHFALYFDDGTMTAINHASLTGGNSKALEQFLLEHTRVQRIEKPLDNRIVGKIANCITAAALVLSLFSGYDFDAVEPKSMTARQAAQVLTELGIEPPGEAVLAELEEYGADPYMMENLLYESGCGQYDLETWEWTPAESGVYTFDMEVWDVGYMYTNFLNGVSAMSRGELDFSDITEDDSLVDFENGTGNKIVTFTFEGQTYTLRPNLMSDWFDLEFADELAKIVGKREDGRRLYYHTDGYQMISVFYEDADWARDFKRATGYPLTNTIG